MRIINKSLTRYQLIFGTERELLIFLGLVSVLIPYSAPTIITIIVGILIWCVGLFFLRRLAKFDPIFFKVFQRFYSHQKYYPAKTPRWSKKNGYRTK